MKVVVLGAPDDTSNLGVNALLYSLLTVLFDRGAQVVVADHGRGVRRRSAVFDGRERCWTSAGLVNTRRYYRPESLGAAHVAARLAPGLLPMTRAIRDADLVLDISGGDSFTDIYGAGRFETVLGQKQLTLEIGTPLVLLPQTYGPFDNERSREAAARIVRASAACASRDPESHAVLRGLLQDSYDPTRHLRGVDVAFALAAMPPGPDEDQAAQAWLKARDHGRPLAGVNVSGLIAAQPERFGISLDYVSAVAEGVRALVAQGADVLLVPHMAGVFEGGRENYEVSAARLVASQLADLGDSISLFVPSSPDPRHAKWWIGQCDWFTGPRMHATIGALSQQVPTLATAYSMKVRGVFATAGQEESVVDLSSLDRDGLVEAFLASFAARAVTRQRLSETMPGLRRRAREQVDEMLDLGAAVAANTS